jgi:hypothetical protein
MLLRLKHSCEKSVSLESITSGRWREKSYLIYRNSLLLENFVRMCILTSKAKRSGENDVEGSR